ncbi:MAG: hypothetical protein ACK5O8_01555 [Pirellula sp.]
MRFWVSNAIFSHWARTFAGRGLEVRDTLGLIGDVRGVHGVLHMSGSGSDAVRRIDCEHAAARRSSSPRVTPI